MMKEYIESSAASRERAIKFAIVPGTQLTESVNSLLHPEETLLVNQFLA